ncbi:hypothetical protein POPTR_009G141800v4 [Populus trichocarpa]|uniref:Uncharacterized protein n=1 Tax=Populus trichocarpa TaxID=3694 RepID=B9HQY4_POPTR|nr:acidic endochitinase WIN6.2C precursor [Populus trichocarpa]PNT21336.2 hypothetical protein POPTR_009G141800v4 [Populus trichocarpa]
MSVWAFFAFFSLFLSLSVRGSAEQCGRQAGDALCPGGLCCSFYGWCGTTVDYCGDGCQSQCDGGDGCDGGGGGGGDGDDGYLSDIIPKSTFDALLKFRNDPRCHAVGFYTYDAFISAAKEFPDFGNTGDDLMRKREIAAFLGQTSHETTGGWPDAPCGPYAWGYCYLKEINCQPYCDPSSNYQCGAGKQYCGRGPIQLSWNYNYGLCGDDLKLPLLQEPELVETDPVISFKTALWFWMKPQSPKPSCHAVITGNWTPSAADVEAGRVPGYGVITNIINGGIECGQGGPNAANEDRIGFYKKYCDKLGTTYGPNLDCYQQRPFGYGLLGLKDTM